LTDTMMETIAAGVNGLNMHRWLADEQSSKAQAFANNVDKLAKENDVGGTPTILVGHVNRTLRNVETPAEIDALQAPTLPETEQAINAALAG